jgi:hypothetical protein
VCFFEAVGFAEEVPPAQKVGRLPKKTGFCRERFRVRPIRLPGNPPAHLVERAADWPWCSLSRMGERPWLETGPAPRGTDWVAGVEATMTEAEERAMRRCVPHSSRDWVVQTAKDLGLEFRLNARGRPPKAARLSNTE